MSSPNSKLPELSDKSKKYDRQIRLWGEHGQVILETAKVCLINANALGCEILKGLVLPGIGSFTIIDGSIVTEEDVGVNFFLNPNSIGHPKSLACMQLLQELNPDVSGDFIDESIDSLINSRPELFASFDVVIACNILEKNLLDLSKILWDFNIPLFYCRSLGMYGSIRLQIKEHCVVESHPDNRQFDLRLENPFPTLKQHLEEAKLTSKVPWVIVLYKTLLKWKETHDNSIPKTYKEKNEFREMIRNSMTADEENYEEAIKAVNTAFYGGKITAGLQKIFADDACRNLNKKNDVFWILAKSLKDFIENENNEYLPLPGVLPDMTADTESYINLQNLYRQQAMLDSDNVYRKCQHFLKELGMPIEQISEKLVRTFCREASGLAVVRGSKIEDEYEKKTSLSAIVEELENSSSLIGHYVVLRAYEKFRTELEYVPGECFVENDTAKLKSIAGKLFAEWGVHNHIGDDLIHEICRYGGAEVHSVSAFVGGCVAQEAIKVLTKQYIPIDNTFLYNAITTETATFKM